MNKSKLALVVALGMSFSSMAVAPAFAEDASTPGAKVETKGKSCAAGECKGGGKHRSGGHRGHGGFMRGLDLTDAQLEKLHSLRTQMSEASGPKRLELKTLHSQLRDNLTKPGINKSELLALQSKINALNADLSNNRVAFMVDASSVFTDEQRQKMRRSMLMGGGRGHHNFHGKGQRGGSRHFGGMKGDAGNQSASPEVSTHEPVAPPEENQG